MQRAINALVDGLRAGRLDAQVFAGWLLDFVTAEDVLDLSSALDAEAVAAVNDLAVAPTGTVILCSSPPDLASSRIQGFFAAWRAHFGLDPKQAA